MYILPSARNAALHKIKVVTTNRAPTNAPIIVEEDAAARGLTCAFRVSSIPLTNSRLVCHYKAVSIQLIEENILIYCFRVKVQENILF